jgi:hypothetical protein
MVGSFFPPLKADNPDLLEPFFLIGAYAKPSPVDENVGN